MSKVETTSKVLLELTTRMNLTRRGVGAKLLILDIVHKPCHSLERVNAINSSKWKVREEKSNWIKDLLGCIPESKKEI